MPHETTILENEVGIQYQGVKNSSSIPRQASMGGLMIGTFKRGRLDRPMTITNENIRGELGHDPENPHYIAVQDALASGVPSVQVLRIFEPVNARFCVNIEYYRYGYDIQALNKRAVFDSLQVKVGGVDYPVYKNSMDGGPGVYASLNDGGVLSLFVNVEGSPIIVCAAEEFEILIRAT